MATYIPQQVEDGASAGGELAVPVLGVRNDAAASKTDNNGDFTMFATDAAGRVGIADLGGSVTVDVTGTVSVTNPPAASGGLTTFHLVSAASTNATSIKGTAGQVYGWYIFNYAAAPLKVAFHNTSSTPTAGSGVFFSLVIPAGSGANVFTDKGIAFGSGIGITTVTGAADSDNTAVAANDLNINIWYN